MSIKTKSTSKKAKKKVLSSFSPPLKVKQLLRRARKYDVDLEELTALCEQSLLFKVVEMKQYLNAKEQAKLFAKCQHFMDKLTSERVRLLRELSFLEGLYQEAEKEIYRSLLEGSYDLRVSDQKAIIEGELLPLVKRIKKYKRALDILEIFVQNADRTHWTITKLQNSLDILTRLER